MKNLSLSLIVSGLISFPVCAELYKWVDEEGNVHYSQSKPNADVTVETIKPPPSIEVEAEQAQDLSQQRKDLLDGFAKQREEAQRRKEHEEKEKAKAERNCAKSKENLSKLEQTRRIKIDDDGDDGFAANEARDKKIALARENIKKWCQ